MKHFLLFQIKPVCYHSYTYFSNSLAKCLSQYGHNITIFSSAKEPLESMERFVGNSFNAVIDFNSELPKLRMDDDTYFLDQIDAPFYDVILDHPLYHHDMLKQKLCNFHVICLDRNHEIYIKTHYPHIRSVHMIPVCGEDICPDDVSYPAKSIDLLFSGSYTAPSQVKESLSHIPGFIGELTEEMIRLMSDDTSLTQEDALALLGPSFCDNEVLHENFSLHMQACFLCDTYLRSFRREQLLLALADSNVPMTLCGNGWRKSPFANYSNIHIIDDTAFEDTFALFRQAKITLNIMPEFKDGAHDRIYSSMLNHSLCLTDATPFLKEQFSDGKNIVYYETNRLKALCDTVKELLADVSKLETITQNGYQKVTSMHYLDDWIKLFA